MEVVKGGEFGVEVGELCFERSCEMTMQLDARKGRRGGEWDAPLSPRIEDAARESHELELPF